MKMNFSPILTGFLFVIGGLGLLDFLLLMSYGTVINTGILLPPVIGVLCIIYAFLRVSGLIHHIKIPPFISIFLKGIISLVILTFIIIEAFIAYSIYPDKNTDADYLIILGAGLKGDQMTLTFKNRVDKGLAYLTVNKNVKAVVTGGQGYGETISEAAAMSRYLIAHGISPQRIIKEEKATSTKENFKFSKQLLDKLTGQNHYKAIIVTSDFHMFRSKLLARRNGFEPYGLPSPTWIGVLPNCFMREYLAVIKTLLFDY